MLQPFTFQYAVDIWNKILDDTTGLLPLDKFGKTIFDHSIFLNSYVWGCPTYILEPNFKDENKLPKWQPRKIRGQLQGFSKVHAYKLLFICNLETEYIIPQFHTVMGD